MAPTSKLLKLPDRGWLLVASDLHGNLRDFLTIVALFERRQREDSSGYLLFLGDLVHGPYLPLEEWEDVGAMPYLRGRPYRDRSPAILLGLSELMERHPGRIFTLLGNHEHAHIGGPRTSLFARDEAVALEQRLGVEASLWLASLIKSLPLCALAPCGLLFSHAAPGAEHLQPAMLDLLDYRRFAPPHRSSRSSKGTSSPDAVARLLGQMLWSESLPPAQAERTLAAIGARVAVYGHAVVAAGYQSIGAQQLILSTSFGMEDERKHVLLVDLAMRYESVSALRPGTELLPLYR